MYTLLTLFTSMCVTISVMDWWNRARQPIEQAIYSSSSSAVPLPVQSKPAVVTRPNPPVTQAPLSQKTLEQAELPPSSTRPKLVKRVEPQYTADALVRKIEGKVELSFFVMPSGNVRTIRVVRRLDTGLDRKAIEALSHWRYSPALVDGRPATVQITEVIEFRLP